jgi:hypothetical protein
MQSLSELEQEELLLEFQEKSRKKAQILLSLALILLVVFWLCQGSLMFLEELIKSKELDTTLFQEHAKEIVLTIG